MRTVLVAVGLVLCMSTVAWAQMGDAGPAGDKRVQEPLDRTGLPYKVDGDGDFRLVVKLDSGRTQVLFINSRTHSYGPFEIREIWSVGYRADGDLPAPVANRLLQDSYGKKIGAWHTEKINGRNAAVFCAKVSAAVSPDQLKALIIFVAESADEMELELTKKDDL